MTSEDYRALSELEEAHREENAAARRRIEQAQEYLSYYRARMASVQESVYELAARNDVVDDAGFRSAFARISDEADENIRGAAARIARFEDDYRASLARQSRELETLAESQRTRRDRRPRR